MQLAGEGTSVEVRVPKAKADTAPTKSVDQWTRLVGKDDTTGTVTLGLPEPGSTRYLLIYLTSLPPVGNNYFRGEIAEITVTGT